MRNPTEPRPLGEALDGVVRSLQGGRQRGGAAAVGGVFGRWTEIVGEAMAAQVRPVKLEGDRLLLEVAEPAWATQVRLLSERISERVTEVVGITIAGVDVRVGGPRR